MKSFPYPSCFEYSRCNWSLDDFDLEDLDLSKSFDSNMAISSSSRRNAAAILGSKPEYGSFRLWSSIRLLFPSVLDFRLSTSTIDVVLLFLGSLYGFCMACFVIGEGEDGCASLGVLLTLRRWFDFFFANRSSFRRSLRLFDASPSSVIGGILVVQIRSVMLLR